MPASNEPEHYRLFVAIHIPGAIRRGLAELQHELQSMLSHAEITWTRPEQFHLTLKFLGNVETRRVGALARNLNAACHGFSPLVFRAQTVGAFPDFNRMRVLWVGLNDALGKLVQLHKRIEAASREFTKEKEVESFRGHVTLGRVKRLKAQERKSLARTVSAMRDRFFGEWIASDIELMRSQLSSQGAQHCSIAKFKLTAQPAT